MQVGPRNKQTILTGKDNRVRRIADQLRGLPHTEERASH